MMQNKVTEKYTEILMELEDFRKKDFSFQSGRILGSMCSEPHPIARDAYNKFLDTNLGDPGLFPGTKQIERQYISFVQSLLHAPPSSAGHIVSGGTEGNITAMWLAKQLSGNKEIIIPASAHFSFQKIASLMDMKLKPIPLTKSYTMDVTHVKRKLQTKTAAVIGIAGSTDLGTIDPIEEIADLCHDEHIFLHVDAAFGGYIIPFLKNTGYKLPQFDFLSEGVSSLSIDAHKMGYAAIPLGVVVFREKQWLDEISVPSQCISSKKQAGILGTRSGGPVAAAYAVSRYLGIEGYQQVVARCMETTTYAAGQICSLGLSLITEPVLNVIAVRLKNPLKVERALDSEGWKVNIIDHLSSIRIVCMPQITKEIIDEFIPVLQKVCQKVGEL
ncbi:MAG: tyrosine decarboxylase MfnA [Candidatus Thermoplasmatota archaeon]|nr:tyrosine decarboxylase MfnA [Candidatus Thermoplasmatota archaeon]